MVSRGEVIVALSSPPMRVPVATHARGTVLCSSIRSLRARNLHEAYTEALEPPHRAALAAVTAATWVPMDTVLAHYRACDGLGVDPAVIALMGAESGRFVYSKIVALAVRFSAGVGATPWNVLAHASVLRARTWLGSDMEVRRVGPKDAHFTWHGIPCAASPYFAVACGAFVAATLEPFCTGIRSRVLREGCDALTLSYLLSWA